MLNFINPDRMPRVRQPSQKFNQRTCETARCEISPPVRRKPLQILPDKSKHHILEARLHQMAATSADQRPKQPALLAGVLDQPAQKR